MEVSIPQAVSAVSTLKRIDREMGTEFYEVSIPQAVSAVSTHETRGRISTQHCQFQYRKR